MTDTRTIKISQSGFALLTETLARFEAQGFGPDNCAVAALHSVGLKPKYGVETIFVVDPMLNRPIYPFMDPKGEAK